MENLFHKIDDKVLSNIAKEKGNYLQGLANYLELKDDREYFDIVDNYTKEEIKKVYQFLVLKALQELKDINYNITPEIIGVYISNIVDIIFENKEDISVLDLASGSGNILISLSEQISKKSKFTSVDVDYNYAKLQQNIFNLLEKEINIINQDALKDINVAKQDVVISDIPYGYYADEENSLNYKLCSQEGYSLNALLFLEQATSYIKDNGVAVLVMPKEIMNIDEQIKKFLEKDINLNAFIMLPENMFKNKDNQKVIVLATKKNQSILPKQVFLAEIPSYQNKSAYLNFLDEIKKWIEAK
ncbi:class I SAM-dependent methyltransferase [Gemella sp. GH3]|uniref:class I SAM-dependent methyltransferase n=1 Tax=unclassified Gemella TaxID=2624949 RepID=UPI0015D0C62A|nr:class I SAM-dependent methyltransferase [Gemella sp. GH3.1]NYS50705.1 class I SAM-dependent methyltransferase [Gemella sp. GH3]